MQLPLALKQEQYKNLRHIKALPFKNSVKSNEYKLLLKTLRDFNCFNVNEERVPAVNRPVEKR